MANIELIKVLRDRTGAGIMDCKNALVECNDDIDKAVDWLRKKGIAKQAKKADRIAAEGLTTVAVCESCGKASVVEINCETDFVSNSDPFKALVKTTADAALKNEPKDVEALKALVESEFTDAAVKLGEKLSLRRFEIVNPGEGEAIGYYIHQGGRISVITLLKTRDDELAKHISMHIAANSPKFVTESEIPADVIEAERKIQIEVCKNDPKLANKPEVALQKIVEGKVNKVLFETVLVDQDFLMDPSKTVGQVLKEKGNEVIKFVRYQVGEGLEKRQDDFAKEVMAQVK